MHVHMEIVITDNVKLSRVYVYDASECAHIRLYGVGVKARLPDHLSHPDHQNGVQKSNRQLAWM